MKYESVLLLLIFTGIGAAVNAGDEDMNPTIYSRFDPETGFMVPVDPATLPPQGHTPATPVTAEPAETVVTDSGSVNPSNPSEQPYPVWIAVLAGLIGLGVIVTMVRKKKPSPGSRVD